MEESKKSLLLIWEMIPEETRLFSIPEGHELALLAELSAGKYINSDDLEEDHAIFKLNDKLNGSDQYAIRNDSIFIGPFTRAIICGFIM